MKNLFLTICLVSLGFASFSSFARGFGGLVPRSIKDLNNHMVVFYENGTFNPSMYAFIFYEEHFGMYEMKISACRNRNNPHQSAKIQEITCEGPVRHTNAYQADVSMSCEKRWDGWSNRKRISPKDFNLTIDSYRKVNGDFYSLELYPLSRIFFGQPLLVKKFGKELEPEISYRRGLDCEGLFGNSKDYDKVRKAEKEFRAVFKRNSKAFANQLPF